MKSVIALLLFLSFPSMAAIDVSFPREKLVCWGQNWGGELGVSDISNRPRPTEVPTHLKESLTGLVSGGHHYCAIGKSTGHVYCWGTRVTERFGTTLAIDYHPTLVALPSPAKALAAGKSHTCALMKNKSVYCWGDGGFGQLGNGSEENELVPVEVRPNPLGEHYAQIVAGENHTCGWTEKSKTAFCWGDGEYGQLGSGNANVYGDRPKPSRVSIPTAVDVSQIGEDIFQLTAGHKHTCGIGAITGKAYCWGRSDSGQLGIGKEFPLLYTERPSPVDVSQIDEDLTDLKASAYHTCGRGQFSGRLYCWGRNNQGELGVGSLGNLTRPTFPVKRVREKLFDVKAGGEVTCGIGRLSHRLYCWGDGTYGHVGNVTGRTKPTQVDFSHLAGFHFVRDYSVNDLNTCAILSNVREDQ